MAPTINFRFIRSGKTMAADDDICTVRRDGDEFTLSFKYKTSNEKSVVNTSQMNSDTVLRWVRRAIDMMEHDADPFVEFQIDFPLLPSILFTVADIGTHYHAILDAIEFTLDNWPAEKKDVDMSDTASVSSMPPLIPFNRVMTRSQTAAAGTQGQHLFF